MDISLRKNCLRICMATILVSLLVKQTDGIKCDSRVYCVTPEVKYISMEEIQSAYLNTTAIKKYKVKTRHSCQQLCIKENKCQAINMKSNGSTEYTCHLLDANRYSNSSLLVSSPGYIHLYIPSKCAKNPCKNDGICVPSYKDDRYSCECKSTVLKITRGKQCEIVLTGYLTAYAYYSFDDKGRDTPITSSNEDMSSYVISWPGASVPDRKSPVVMCKGGSDYCMLISKSLPCVNVFHKCTEKVTYSIWLKYQRKQVGKTAYIIQRYYPSHRAGISFLSSSNGYSASFHIGDRKKWSINGFGKHINQSLWNQFTFTVDNTAKACAYINGVKEQCDTQSSYDLYYVAQNTGVRIGGRWPAGPEPAIYFDDFAIWKSIPTDDEIMQLYKDSRI